MNTVIYPSEPVARRSIFLHLYREQRVSNAPYFRYDYGVRVDVNGLSFRNRTGRCVPNKLGYSANVVRRNCRVPVTGIYFFFRSTRSGIDLGKIRTEIQTKSMVFLILTEGCVKHSLWLIQKCVPRTSKAIWTGKIGVILLSRSQIDELNG